MSYLETRAGPKMGRQILGDSGGKKMAITSLKIKIFKRIQDVLAQLEQALSVGDIKFWLLKTSIFGVLALP